MAITLFPRGDSGDIRACFVPSTFEGGRWVKWENAGLLFLPGYCNPDNYGHFNCGLAFISSPVLHPLLLISIRNKVTQTRALPGKSQKLPAADLTTSLLFDWVECCQENRQTCFGSKKPQNNKNNRDTTRKSTKNEHYSQIGLKVNFSGSERNERV